MHLASFVTGCLIGAVAGALLIGPALRAALAIHEYRQASREAELTDELLRRMAQESTDAARPLE